MTTKTCRRCGETKQIADFYAWPNGATKAQCLPCDRVTRADRYRENNGIDASYDQVLRREYGITIEQYRVMEREQGKRCAICRRPETVTYKTGRVRRLAVDHDHATNSVRALLCHRCNLLVWALEDNHTTLSAVDAYVRQHQAAFATP